MSKFLTNFHLNEGSFFWQSSWQNTRVTEAGPQQHGQDEEEEKSSEDWDGWREMDSQVWTSEEEEKKNAVIEITVII